MIANSTEVQRINLLPGELVIAKNGETIWTVLGSCVTVILYNSRLKISAVCHAQLPSRTLEIHCSTSCTSPCRQNESCEFKYVSCSIEYMLDQFHKLGIQNREIDVRLYGGANVLELSSDKPRIGDKNVSKAKQILREKGLTIFKEDTGGNKSRSITHLANIGMTKLKIN